MATQISTLNHVSGKNLSFDELSKVKSPIGKNLLKLLDRTKDKGISR